MADNDLLTAPAEPVVTAPASSWRDTLPDDLKADKSLESFKDVPALAKSFIETKKLVGTKQTPAVPGDKASPEEVSAWRKALGVPDTPEGYTPKQHPIMALPEWNKEAQGAFLKLAHEESIPPKTLDRILGFYGDFVAAGLKDADRMAADAKGELRTDWGVNYDAYIGAAKNGVSRLATALEVKPEDLFEATKGTDPALVAKLFHYVESQFTEHGWVPGEPVRGTTPEMAVSKITELQARLLTVPRDSEQARAIIEEISQVGRALARA